MKVFSVICFMVSSIALAVPPTEQRDSAPHGVILASTPLWGIYSGATRSSLCENLYATRGYAIHAPARRLSRFRCSDGNYAVVELLLRNLGYANNIVMAVREEDFLTN